MSDAPSSKWSFSDPSASSGFCDPCPETYRKSVQNLESDVLRLTMEDEAVTVLGVSSEIIDRFQLENK